jgi:hypothetical protein
VEKQKTVARAAETSRPASSELLLLPAEAAAVLRLKSAGTLAVWRCTHRHGLKFVKVGGRVMYRRSDLLEFIASRVVDPHAEPAAPAADAVAAY